jgi:predicted O-methyltransferase YrrM
MAGRHPFLPEGLSRYIVEHSVREPAVLKELRQATASHPQAGMQIGADQGALLGLLARLIGARYALEIGTFTGMSALAVGAALPADGRLITCDVSEEWTGIARRYWAEAGLGGRIEVRLGPALDTLRNLLLERGAGSFDLAFIDADKAAYDAYYEACLTQVRAGGLIVLDNMLWHGAVADTSDHEPTTEIIRSLNLKIRDDPRVESCLLTVGDGVVVARRR